jgi:predicted Zn-dependent peptidase
MTWVRACLFVVVVAVSCLLTRAASAQALRPVVARQLGNGLRVVVCPDPAGVDVSVVVQYDVGARDEPEGLEGLAHHVEHLMFSGSRHVGPGEHFRLLDRVGATNVNASTSLDTTTYVQTLPPERLELALWLESDRMGTLVDRLHAPVVARERGVLLNEYRMRVVDTAFGLTPGVLLSSLFPAWHPYQHTIAGNPQSIGRARLEDAQAFLRTWYGPANAIVVISGKVDPTLAVSLVERYFATLRPRRPPARPALPPLPPPEAVRVVVGANVTRAEVTVAWVTPPHGAAGDEELDLVAGVLSGQGTGWLHQLLVDERRVALAVGARQQSMALASVFAIRATVADGRTTGDVLAAIDAAVDALARVTEHDVERARRVLVAGQWMGLESSMNWALRLASLARLGRLPTAFDGRVGRYERYRAADVAAAARRYLPRAHRVVVAAEKVREAPVEGVVLSQQEL